MPSQPCSRIGFRKSRRSAPAALIFVSVFLLPASLHATIEHDTTVSGGLGYLKVTITARGADPEPLFSNLADGLTARVEYVIRALESRDGALGLVGSRLLREFRVIYTVGWDPFRDRYRLTTQDGGAYTFRDEATLWSFLFTLPDYRIPWSAFGERSTEDATFSVDTRVEYEPIVFAPGLSILSVFLRDSRHVSPWLESNVEVPTP
ncbi:MAG: hypothetical protein ACOC1I_06820 [Spirochaetota bacterium]